MNRQFPRRAAALCLAALTLWTCAVTAESETLPAAVSQLHQTSLPRRLLRWELGDFEEADHLSPVTLLALGQSPLLLSQRENIARFSAQPPKKKKPKNPAKQPVKKLPKKEQPASADFTAGLRFRENGAPAETVRPTSTRGYTVVNGVYIKNTSSRTIDKEALSPMDFSARLRDGGPQVLIIHSHGSEAYDMPKGEKYKPTGSYRTDDREKNIVRIGAEMVKVLESHGIHAIQDRTLHDVPDYNQSYDNSYDAIERYVQKYPTIQFVLDVHRDAIADADGHQYKLITAEEPRAAQVSLVMGAAHDNWQDNTKLAIAVEHHIQQDHPTLLRPISVIGYRYNQHFAPGSLLVEIGAAGNSLDEAILAARLFAPGFAETIQHP